MPGQVVAVSKQENGMMMPILSTPSRAFILLDFYQHFHAPQQGSTGHAQCLGFSEGALVESKDILW